MSGQKAVGLMCSRGAPLPRAQSTDRDSNPEFCWFTKRVMGGIEHLSGQCQQGLAATSSYTLLGGASFMLNQ
jgi:hypothetical protein